VLINPAGIVDAYISRSKCCSSIAFFLETDVSAYDGCNGTRAHGSEKHAP